MAAGMQKVPPKLGSTSGAILSGMESGFSPGEPATKHTLVRQTSLETEDLFVVPNPCQAGGSTGMEESRDGAAEQLGKEEVPRGRDGQKERLKGSMRGRLWGSVEVGGEDGSMAEKEPNKRRMWNWRARGGKGDVLGREGPLEESDGDRWTGAAHGTPGKVEQRVQRTILSRLLVHSSASSSSSSSLNCSSPESDDVFSEGEDSTLRRRTRRKGHSWRTFLTMMQWSKRRQSSWVQLAGHQGNFHPSEGGEVLKRFNAVESSCLQALMSDGLQQFVPQYYGLASRGEESYIRLEDLLSGLTCPVIMDCKMGVRTYLEEELIKARQNPCLRSDMYQKMMKVDPAAPTAEEHKQGAVTKPRYMQWRDSVSSTSTLGFRIEGITMENGTVLRDFKLTRTLAQVTDTLLSFTKKQPHILEAYRSRLIALDEALKNSEFFQAHEIIGSSLLFVHDRKGKASIWMIDFGKTSPTPSSVHLKHNIPWAEGNREDGYLIGLATLTSVVEKALQQTCGRGLAECGETGPETETQMESGPEQGTQELPQNLPLEPPAFRDSGIGAVLSKARLEPSGNGPQLAPINSEAQTSPRFVNTHALDKSRDSTRTKL